MYMIRIKEMADNIRQDHVQTRSALQVWSIKNNQEHAYKTILILNVGAPSGDV